MIASGQDVYIVLQTNCAVLAEVDESIGFGPFNGWKVDQDIV